VRTRPCRRVFGVSGAHFWRLRPPSAPRAYRPAPTVRPPIEAGYPAGPDAPSPVRGAAPVARRQPLVPGRTWDRAERGAPRLPCPLRRPGKCWPLRRSRGERPPAAARARRRRCPPPATSRQPHVKLDHAFGKEAEMPVWVPTNVDRLPGLQAALPPNSTARTPRAYPIAATAPSSEHSPHPLLKRTADPVRQREACFESSTLPFGPDLRNWLPHHARICPLDRHTNYDVVGHTYPSDTSSNPSDHPKRGRGVELATSVPYDT